MRKWPEIQKVLFVLMIQHIRNSLMRHCLQCNHKNIVAEAILPRNRKVQLSLRERN